MKKRIPGPAQIVMSMEEAFVQRKRRSTAVVWGLSVVMLLLAFGSFFTLYSVWASLPILQQVLFTVVTWLAMSGALTWSARALAYKHGWLTGRNEMVLALREASHRGISIEDWLESEMERQIFVMGIPRDVFADAAKKGC